MVFDYSHTKTITKTTEKRLVLIPGLPEILNYAIKRGKSLKLVTVSIEAWKQSSLILNAYILYFLFFGTKSAVFS